jgi:alpha,alpha-trehalase
MTTRRLLQVVCLFCFFSSGLAQILPEKEYPELFHDVQLSGVFPDSKTFPDCVPIIDAAKLDSIYIQEKDLPGFNLSDFISTYFVKPKISFDVFSDSIVGIDEHIDYLWDILIRRTPESEGTLIGLPLPYVVPGGRFREVYYWDTYFTMLGLAESGYVGLVKDMIDNFAYLIDTFGFIPNGNRTYYLSRSQPPFFSLMIELLASIEGEQVFSRYLSQLQAEYDFWMNGKAKLTQDNCSFRRVVLVDNKHILNRYWDDKAAPRDEAYLEDLKIAHLSPEPDSIDYQNIRAACESGWDFSSRWLRDPQKLETIETTNILPIDLNCLLFNAEKVLAKGYEIIGKKDKATYYTGMAKARKKAIQKYFWNKKEGFYTDYNWMYKSKNKPEYASGMFPLFLGVASKGQAKIEGKYIHEKLIAEGGILTSCYHTGQQWDAPNGWAPLQYIAIVGLQNYNQNDLAKVICDKWLGFVRNVYLKEGKLVEKYNVENIHSKGGGGEYPAQDGFGWTNGVYLRLKDMDFRK